MKHRLWVAGRLLGLLLVWAATSQAQPQGFGGGGIATPVTVQNGGTGGATLTSGAYLKGAGTSPITTQAPPIPVSDGGTGTTTFPSGTYLKGAGAGAVTTQALPIPGATILDRVATATTVSNTITETTIYSFSVPGGTLSTNVRLRLTLATTVRMFSAGITSTLRFKYGATTLVSIAPVSAATTVGTTAYGYWITVLLSGNGATGSQLGSMHTAIDQADPDVSTTSLVAQQVRGTSAVDSTVAQTLTVTWQWGAANASNIFVMEHAVLEQL